MTDSEKARMFSDDSELVSNALEMLREARVTQHLCCHFPGDGHVTVFPFPTANAQREGSRRACRWLIDQAIQYLNTAGQPVVLFEDLIARPGDPWLHDATLERPRYWSFGDGVFWPVKTGSNAAGVEQALWARAGFRTIVAFTAGTHDDIRPEVDLELTEEQFQQFGASATRLIADLWDGEWQGFVSWERVIS